MTLQPIPSELPYIWGKFDFLFYQYGHPPANPKTERTKDDLCVSLFISLWFNTKKWAYILFATISFLVCIFMYCSYCIQTKHAFSYSKQRPNTERGRLERSNCPPHKPPARKGEIIMSSLSWNRPTFFDSKSIDSLNDFKRTAFSPSYDLAPCPTPSPPPSRH
jgi:hypothetical protein